MSTPTARPLTALAATALLFSIAGCTATTATAQHDGRLPEGFPADIPIAQPVDAGSLENGSWRIRSDVADAGAQGDALQALLDVGFVVVGEATDDEHPVYSLAKGQYTVRLAFERHGDTFSVTYGVLDNS